MEKVALPPEAVDVGGRSVSSARILLVDDHEITRRGLKIALEAAWKICGDAVDGLQAISKAVELKPDLVLMDINMPRMSGIRASKEIKLLCPLTKILIFTLYD